MLLNLNKTDARAGDNHDHFGVVVLIFITFTVNPLLGTLKP